MTEQPEPSTAPEKTPVPVERIRFSGVEHDGNVQRSDEEVERAVTNPPHDTRAYFRGECLRRFGADIVLADTNLPEITEKRLLKPKDDAAGQAALGAFGTTAFTSGSADLYKILERVLEEFEAVASAVDVPVLANMTEFGKSELFTARQLEDAGVRIVIHPVSLLRVAMGAAERALDELVETGTLAGQVPNMQTRARLYELVDYAGYAAFDDGIFTSTGYGRPVSG